MFYTFHQNNSGGQFIIDEEVSIYVIIEADDSYEANTLAQTHGVYFDGCSYGQDCSCCGDRWYTVYNDEGDIEPSIYGEPISNWKRESNFIDWNKDKKYPDVYIYYKNDNVGKHNL